MVADLLLNRSKHGLKNLEAQRRAAAQAKLDATRLLWESYQAVLEAGHVEAAKVHRLVLGIAASHDLMARSMATTKKKKRSAASSGEDAATGASAEAKDVMQSLQASTDTVGELFAKSAYDLLGIDVKIKELVGDMRDGVQNLAGAEVHLASMEQAEEQVREAWGKDLALASVVSMAGWIVLTLFLCKNRRLLHHCRGSTSPYAAYTGQGRRSVARGAALSHGRGTTRRKLENVAASTR